MHNGRLYFDEIKTIIIGEPPQALLPLGSLYNVHNMQNGRLYFDETKTIIIGEPPQVLLSLGRCYRSSLWE